MIADLIKKNRSCRRFYQDHAVPLKTLKDMVNLARLSASAANLQPLNYILSSNPEKNDLIFSCLAWAGYIKDWPGPKEGERPAAYIIVLGNTDISKNFGCDHGIASQSMLLGVREKGLAGCMLGAINRKKLRKILNIPPKYKILLVLAIGKPKEKVVIKTVASDSDSPNTLDMGISDMDTSDMVDKIKDWRDSRGVHHVPKRKLSDIILDCY